jgi:hypothetical protein
MIDHCYANGTIGSNGFCFVGSDPNAMIYNCYYLNSTGCVSNPNHYEGKTDAEMKNLATYIGWSTSIWETTLENNGYPSFIGLPNRKPNMENENSKSADNIFIYPNPANNNINLDFMMDCQAIGSIYIYNNYGQLVDTIRNGDKFKKGFNSIQFDTQRLISGAYFISIEYNGKTLSSPFNIVK